MYWRMGADLRLNMWSCVVEGEKCEIRGEIWEVVGLGTSNSNDGDFRLLRLG